MILSIPSRMNNMNSALQFSISPYTPFMQETKVNLGNGIELHVEVGGKPEHPTILLIMGLGAQMLFWPDFSANHSLIKVFVLFVLITVILAFLQKSAIKVNV